MFFSCEPGGRVKDPSWLLLWVLVLVLIFFLLIPSPISLPSCIFCLEMLFLLIERKSSFLCLVLFSGLLRGVFFFDLDRPVIDL